MSHEHHAHDHTHAHDHGHTHEHGHTLDHAHCTPVKIEAEKDEVQRFQERRLRMVFGLTMGFFVAEYTGAVWARSSVLKLDAVHLLMDVLALGASLFAMALTRRPATPRFSFGFGRAESLVALFNAGLVLIAVVEIVREGIEKWSTREPPLAGPMLLVSIGALLVNGLSAYLLHGAIHHGHDHDHAGHDHRTPEHAGHQHSHEGHALNLRSARLHLLGDTLGSLAALVAALVIYFGGPAFIDPVASWLVGAILLFGAVRLVREASWILLEAAPRAIRMDKLTADLEATGLHIETIHVWAIGAGKNSAACIVKSPVTADVREKAGELMRTRYSVGHFFVDDSKASTTS